MPRQISPANAWCFTLNNYTAKEFEFLSSTLRTKSEKYFYIVGKEVGESGTPHLQGYIALKAKKKKFRPLPTFAVNRNGKNAIHFERARGNRQHNYVYCSKDGDFITNITPSAEQMEHEELQRVIARRLMARIKALTERIDEVTRDVNATEADGFAVLNELIGPMMTEKNELINEFFNHDYDLYIWE